MDRDVLESIRTLLQTTRVLSLAYVMDGVPEAALLPFAPSDDYRAVLVQASTLARHAEALQAGARLGVLVHAQDSVTSDPLQLARLSVAARVAVLDKDSAAFQSAAPRFIARFPAAEVTLGFDDFSLYALSLESGRFVEGFARAFDVTADTFAKIAHL